MHLAGSSCIIRVCVCAWLLRQRFRGIGPSHHCFRQVALHACDGGGGVVVVVVGDGVGI